jgi:hypothetical protein
MITSPGIIKVRPEKQVPEQAHAIRRNDYDRRASRDVHKSALAGWNQKSILHWDCL